MLEFRGVRPARTDLADQFHDLVGVDHVLQLEQVARDEVGHGRAKGADDAGDPLHDGVVAFGGAADLQGDAALLDDGSHTVMQRAVQLLHKERLPRDDVGVLARGGGAIALRQLDQRLG